MVACPHSSVPRKATGTEVKGRRSDVYIYQPALFPLNDRGSVNMSSAILCNPRLLQIHGSRGSVQGGVLNRPARPAPWVFTVIEQIKCLIQQKIRVVSTGHDVYGSTGDRFLFSWCLFFL